MNSDEQALHDTDQRLHQEADHLLHERGVLEILRRFGKPHIAGSYALNLMTWRDLDIYLEAPAIEVVDFLELGRQVAAVLRPWKMSFTNHRDFPATEPLVGLYYGLRLGELSRGAWKIDLWALDGATCVTALEPTQSLAAALTPTRRTAILRIKSDLWNHSEYRKTITSQMIYDAVIEHGARSTTEFWRLQTQHSSQ
ncbi:MAG: hypothetical protein ACOC9P_01530 [bacterium]